MSPEPIAQLLLGRRIGQPTDINLRTHLGFLLMSMMILSCTRGTEEGAGRRRERCGDLGLTSGEILGQGNIDAADLNVSDRKSTRLNSSHANISYAVFCLKKKKI